MAAAIVSNATPLIYLAKGGRLELLKGLYMAVLVPEAVFQEVVVEGKRLQKPDAFVVEKAVEEGWLKVVRSEPVVVSARLGEGERAALGLAKARSLAVLLDESNARLAARHLGIEVVGTGAVLLAALMHHLLDFDGFVETLERLVLQGFRLREEVYLELVRRARVISEEGR